LKKTLLMIRGSINAREKTMNFFRIAIQLCLFIVYTSPLLTQTQLTQITGHLEVWNGNDPTSVYIGQEAGLAVRDTMNFRNTFVGHRSGLRNTSGHSNSFYGDNAGERNVSGYRNSFYGDDSGRNNTSGANNAFFGKSSGNANNEGKDNSFFGAYAGFTNTTGENNSFYGYFAARDNTEGNNNSFFGEQAGFLNATGSSNVFIGQASGLSNVEGSRNTFVGTASGTASGDRNICVGNNSGPLANPLGDDRLYIDVIRSDEPLIYGEFDNNLIRVNGSLDVTNGITGVFNGSSDVNLKEDFVKINDQVILEKILSLPILEWRYKGSEERHIGPMAQDFYSAFNLGQGDRTIATVDADGVTFAAIKALYVRTINRAELAEERIRLVELELLELRKLVEDLVGK